MSVRVRLLGPVDIASDGAARTVAGLRRKAVLAVLALQAGEVVGVDRLIEAVWDSSPPATATNTLQGHVSYLRRILGLPGAIVARAHGYVLDLGPDTTDVQVAERLIETGRGAADAVERVARLESALALWRGAPLADLAGTPWFAARAERLERLRRTAEHALVETRLALGEHESLVPELQAAAERRPFDEELHGRLMVALYRSGRQVDALAVFRRLRQSLRDELGIDPSTSLRDLEVAMLRQDPALSAPAARTNAAALLERAEETRLVDQALDRAATGRTGSVLIFEGPAGIGKTTLLGRARERAQAAGFTVAAARGTDLETDYAWGCVRQLFERFGRDAAGPPAGDDPAGAGEYPFVNRLFWLTSDLAERDPLLVMVDDLHWADVASIRFLAYLAARLDGLPLVLVAALRPGAARIAHLVSVIAAMPTATTRTVRPLTLDGTAELLNTIADAAPPPDLVRRCHDIARGNPLLLRELGRQLATGGEVSALTPGVARFVTAQLRGLPAGARPVAHALAVLGADAAAGQVAGTARIPLRDTLDALSLLAVGELVVVGGVPERFSYAHPMIQAAVYDTISAGDRAELHLRAAQRHHDVVKAAAHLVRVPPGFGELDNAGILTRAAETCLARGSVESAVGYLRRLLDEELGERRPAALAGLGQAEVLVDSVRAIEHLSAALDLESDPETRGEISLALGGALWFAGRPRAAARVWRTTLERENGLSAGTRQALQAHVGNTAYATSNGADIVRVFAGFGAQEPGSSAGGMMLQAVLALHDAFGNRREQAERRALRVAAGDGLVGHLMAESSMGCVWQVLALCDTPQALPSIAASLSYARQAGSLRAAAPAFCFRALVMLAHGDLSEAVRDARDGWDAAKAGSFDTGLLFTGNILMAAFVAAGDLPAAEAILTQVRAARTPELSASIYSEGEMAVLLARGDPARALELIEATGHEYDSFGLVNPVHNDWRGPRVRCLTELGRHAEAAATADDLLTMARTWGTARGLGRALRVAAGTRPGPDGLDLLGESVQVLETSEAKLEHATSRYLLGEALRGAGHLADARGHLQTAQELAAVCGARPLVQAATAALRRSGGLARIPATTLTPTEADIAGLRRSGLSSREIAERLYLTTRTVDDHLGSIARKRQAAGHPE